MIEIYCKKYNFIARKKGEGENRVYIYIYPSEINISCIAFTGMSYINNLFNKHHVWCQYAIFFID